MGNPGLAVRISFTEVLKCAAIEATVSPVWVRYGSNCPGAMIARVGRGVVTSVGAAVGLGV
jgi:hypothetical protein